MQGGEWQGSGSDQLGVIHDQYWKGIRIGKGNINFLVSEISREALHWKESCP